MQASLPRFAAPEGGALTDEMRKAFVDVGVLILEDFVSADKCNALRARTRELVDEFDAKIVKSIFSTTDEKQLADSYFIESGDKIRFFFEEDAFDETGGLRQSKLESLNKIGHAMHDLDPVFDEFSHTPELAQVVNGLGVADPAIIQSMYIFKPPRIGGEVKPHQDSTYLYTEPDSCIGFWFALEDATVDNGCMYFLPGEHTGPLRQRNFRVDDNTVITETLIDKPWPLEQSLPAEAKIGTLVVFHGRTPHMSRANMSAKSRHAYSLHVIDRQCRYPPENWLQRGGDLPLRGFD